MTPDPRSPGPAAEAVSLSDVSVIRGGHAILEDVDWEVRPEDRWVVLGPNGSGKTTLLKVAGARLMPSRGTASVVGQVFGRSDLRDVRARVSLVSAATLRAFRPFLTAREVVVTGRDAALFPIPRRYTEEDWALADRLLGLVTGGTDSAPSPDALFGVLSEGERQQVLMARSLMPSPELILLDEPAAGLDLASRERLIARIGSLAADPTMPAIVLVTHHLEEIPAGFTHGLLLAEGRVLAAGAIEDVLTSPLVSKCFGVSVHVEMNGGRWWARAEL